MEAIVVQCEVCGDTGWKHAPNQPNRVERCDCSLERAIRQKLAIIPLQYREANLKIAEPSDASFASHQRQADVLSALRKRPDGSWLFMGPTGVGKSYLLWSLYRRAVGGGAQHVFAAQTADLVDHLREAASGSLPDPAPHLPTISAIKLVIRTGGRPRVFLDEWDKVIGLTEFALMSVRQLLDVLDRGSEADGRGVQLVVATNLNRKELSENWGGDVVRRLERICTPVDWFEAECAVK